MGASQEKYTCCMSDKKQSIMEISFFESFVRGSNYESPIPDEVCVEEVSKWGISEGVFEDWSTDNEKIVEIDNEPCKNPMKVSKISFGTKNLIKRSDKQEI